MNGILLDSQTNDIVIDPNSQRIMIGDIAVQNARLIIECNKGEIKERPLKGVGLNRFTDEHTPERLIREIKKEFFSEGLEIGSLRLGETLELDVNYKN